VGEPGRRRGPLAWWRSLLTAARAPGGGAAAARPGAGERGESVGARDETG
jgi:hypothetical protein